MFHCHVCRVPQSRSIPLHQFQLSGWASPGRWRVRFRRWIQGRLRTQLQHWGLECTCVCARNDGCICIHKYKYIYTNTLYHTTRSPPRKNHVTLSPSKTWDIDSLKIARFNWCPPILAILDCWSREANPGRLVTVWDPQEVAQGILSPLHDAVEWFGAVAHLSHTWDWWNP